MTAKAEVPPTLAQELQSAIDAQEDASALVDQLIGEAVQASSVGAVGRLLGISRQAVQQRLAAARGRQA